MPRVERPTEVTRLDIGVLRRAIALAKPFWLGPRNWRAWVYLAFTIGLTAFNAFFTTQSLAFQRTQTNALVAHHAPVFWHAFLLAQLLSFGATLMFLASSPYTSMFLLWWRASLTDHVLNRYLSRNNYLRINSASDIDNPDQRIQDDINNALTSMYGMVQWVLSTVATMIVLVPLVWREAGPKTLGIVIAVGSISLIYPKIFSFFVRYDNLQYKAEANFRFGLVRLRENAEAIAFFRGEPAERSELGSRFERIVSIVKFLIIRQLYQGIFFGFYFSLIGIVPTLLLAPRYLHGEMDLGSMQNISAIMGRVEVQFSLGILFFSSFLQLAVTVNRLSNFVERMEHPPETPPEERIRTVESDVVALSDVSVATPDTGRVLVTGLTLTVPDGGALLITGPNGSGKSSLLRVIAGLWDRGAGVVARPPHSQMAFLPQRPYMVLGDLRTQLLYPQTDSTIPDEALIGLLRSVKLEYLVETHSLHERMDWAALLSLGEQQRIAFVRLFVTPTRYAILDEATSAMDLEMEATLYKRLRETRCGIVSVAHRSTLLPYHDRVLTLSGEGSWTLNDAKEVAKASKAEAMRVADIGD